VGTIICFQFKLLTAVAIAKGFDDKEDITPTAAAAAKGVFKESSAWSTNLFNSRLDLASKTLRCRRLCSSLKLL
jgi:hypothetical protein